MTDKIYETQDLIDDFMGRDHWRVHPHHKHRSYHNDWNMLMPVVEKIGNIDSEWLKENDIGESPIRCMMTTDIFVPIQVVHHRIVEFIKWYNSNQPKDSEK